MNDRMKWWAEALLDALATWLLGWLLLGSLVAAMLDPGKDAGDMGELVPLLGRVVITYAVWKLLRTFNWLKGVPPKLL